MAELVARSAFEGLGLPLTVGGCTLAALPETPRVSVAPFRGREAAVAAALAAELPVGAAEVLPGGGRIVWAGLGQWLVEGAVPDLAGLAAVVDQSDAWVVVRLEGAGTRAEQVLARLVPIDLHPHAFPPGRAARTMLRHVACLLVAVEAGFDIAVMRSNARTAVEELAEAMRRVSARAELAAELTPGREPL